MRCQTTTSEPQKLGFYVIKEGSMTIFNLEACNYFCLIEFSKEVCMIDGIIRIKQVEGDHPIQVIWKTSPHITTKGSTNPQCASASSSGVAVFCKSTEAGSEGHRGATMHKLTMHPSPRHCVPVSYGNIKVEAVSHQKLV